MKYSKLFIPLVMLLVLALPTLAQTTHPYDLTWLAFDSNANARGGQYEVAATLGQLDSGLLSGGDYTVDGHFGNGGETIATPTPSPTNRQNQVYFPIISKK
jgi:hypothetical protein